MHTYRRRRGWSDKFLPLIRPIIGEFLIDEPAVAEDELRNTDLIVLGMEAKRVACRIRKAEYYAKYPDDFTIRSWVSSGNKTELTKIIEGWGDILFYGFVNEEETKLVHWKILDLNVFRLWFVRQIRKNAGETPGQTLPNDDNLSKLTAFNSRSVKGLILKEWTQE